MKDHSFSDLSLVFLLTSNISIKVKWPFLKWHLILNLLWIAKPTSPDCAACRWGCSRGWDQTFWFDKCPPDCGCHPDRRPDFWLCVFPFHWSSCPQSLESSRKLPPCQTLSKAPERFDQARNRHPMLKVLLSFEIHNFKEILKLNYINWLSSSLYLHFKMA